MKTFNVTRNHVLAMARQQAAEAARNAAAAAKCGPGESFERNTYLGLARDARITHQALATLATVGALRAQTIEIKA